MTDETGNDPKVIIVPRRKKKPGHTVIDKLTGDLNCYHCGDSYAFRRILPAPVNIAGAVMKAFGQDHRRCKKTKSRRRP